MIAPTDSRWLAGVFDVRGKIAAYWSRGTKRKPSPKWNFIVYLDCRREGVIDAVKMIAGGGCAHTKKSNQHAPEGWRQSQRTRYVTSGERARVILRQIRPFVQVVGDEIDKALEMDEKRPNKPRLEI